jgi:pyruvate dehydrogenase E2 component (dihydrolipoamide acetyltransferase)
MLASRLVSSAVRTNAVRRVAASSRHFTPSAVLSDGDLPYHIIVGMPALSPTMETGILSEWYIPEGSAFAAGQSLAKIETDKATIDYEAQDDGVIAKIFMEAGTGEDIPVGTPIMMTVEEMEDVAAFADFQLPEEETAPEPEAPKAVAAPSPAPVTPPPQAPVAPPPAVAEPVTVLSPEMEELLVAAVAPVLSTGWGDFAKINSPIAKTLSKQQNEYVKKYGTTGQVPL